MRKTELFNLPKQHRLFVFNYVNLILSTLNNKVDYEIFNGKIKIIEDYLHKNLPQRLDSFSNFPIGQKHIYAIYEIIFSDISENEQIRMAFKMAKKTPKNQYRLLEHLLRSHFNLQEALKDLSNYYNLINPNHHLHITQDSIVLKSKFTDQKYESVSLFFELSWLCQRMHNIFNSPLIHWEEVHQKKDSISLKIDKASWKLRSPRPDPNMKKILHRQAQETLNQLFGFDYNSIKNKKLSETIKYLLTYIQTNQIGLAHLSSHLGFSERTLQRRFEAEDISFTELIQFIRSEMAKQMLEVPVIKVTDIAQSLGYSESSAFNRAFKKWEGISPLKYRKNFID